MTAATIAAAAFAALGATKTLTLPATTVVTEIAPGKTEADYDALIAGGKALAKSFEEHGPAVVAGPAVLRFGESALHNLALDVRSVPLPNQTRATVDLRFEHVVDRDGHEVYEDALAFGLAPKPELKPSQGKTPRHVTWLQSVSLKTWALMHDVSKVEGRVVVTLPIGVESADFTLGDKAVKKDVGGLALGVKTGTQPNTVVLSGAVQDPRVIAAVGLDAKGNPVAAQFTGCSPTLCDLTLKAPVATLRLVVAREMVERSFLFVLKRDVPPFKPGPHQERSRKVKDGAVSFVEDFTYATSALCQDRLADDCGHWRLRSCKPEGFSLTTACAKAAAGAPSTGTCSVTCQLP